MTGGRRQGNRTTQIELVEASDADRPVLESLAQLYQYDFSEMARGDPQHGDVRPDGRFHNIDWDLYYANEERYEYLVRMSGSLAGFALVLPIPSFRDPDETVWHMGEFFVMRKYRRLGVGEHVATTLFDRFPGTWQVAESDVNTGAQAFWRDVIGRYTGRRFEEQWLADENWLGPVQYFSSPGAGR
ncbi:MAG: GNAT family N-acetyltransferase [Actinomycetota bacterium]